MFEIGLLYPPNKYSSTIRYGLSQDIMKDLNLSEILEGMAQNNQNIYDTCRSVLMNPINDEKVLKFRQEMVLGAIESLDFYKGAWDLANQAVEEIEKELGKSGKKSGERSKTQEIYESVQLLLIQVKYLEKLKEYMRCEEAEGTKGMMDFVKNLRKYFSDSFAEELRNSAEHIGYLMEGGRLVFTAGIVGGMKCGHVVINRLEPVDYRKMSKNRQALRRFVLRYFSAEAILLNETTLKQEGAEMETNGLHYTLQVYRKFIHEFQEFFEQFRMQIGFYVGCGNLFNKMENLGMACSMPRVMKDGHNDFRGLYELSMALQTLKKPVDNSLADYCNLHIISGANQGGKSTFLRSVGIAQVMMQAGMFVPAQYFESKLYDTILTHFTRREDASMNSGRLVEEMKRMNRIVGNLTSNSLVLLNESFSSTTEKEGSQIAENIIQAFYDSGVTVYMVTHLFAFANKMYEKQLEKASFLSAERKNDGTRTFKVIPHEPTETSFGLDLYDEIIGTM